MSERVPYSRQWIDEDDVATVVDTLRSDYLTQGPAVPAFEAAIGALHQIDHVVAVANATGALHIACLALGLQYGGLLWTSPLSFVASANCGRYCGADVDFVDIDPITRNMSVDALVAKLADAERAERLPDIVVPVDFSGLPTDMPAIRGLADRYGFKIIEDASHAVGATLAGRPVGAGADITVFSFHPVKIVTTGEGGVCATNDAHLAAKLRLLRSHGITRDPTEMTGVSDGPWYYEQFSLGFNYRITDIQAALGTSQLRRLPAMHASRDARARRYDALLADLPLKLPARLLDRESAHHLYAVEVAAGARSDRDTVFAALNADGISANVHYIPIHLQPYYRAFGFARGDFPAAEAYYDAAISIPLFPQMTDAQQDRVVESLRRSLT